MKDIKLRKNHLLIEVIAGSRIKGGIHLTQESADQAAREATYGRVVAKGPEATLKVGEFVLYKQYVGNELKHSILNSNFHYIVVSEDDILAVVPKDLGVSNNEEILS